MKKYLCFILLLSTALFSEAANIKNNYIPYRKGNKWGLCNKDKKVIVRPRYDAIGFYSSELGGYPVKLNRRYGLINGRNKSLIPRISKTELVVGANGFIEVVSNRGVEYYSPINHKRIPEKDMALYRQLPVPEDEEEMEWQNAQVSPGYHKLSTYTDNQDYQIRYNPYNEFFLIGQLDSEKPYVQFNPYGIYLPKNDVLLLCSWEIEYRDAVWSKENRKYFVAFRQEGLYGVMDDQRNMIIDAESRTPIKLTPKSISFTPVGAPEASTLIIKTQCVMRGTFLFETYVYTREGFPFEIFYKNAAPGDEKGYGYIGENGLKYFDD